MGYDLYVCDRNGEMLHTNYEDDLYFRRNIFGMGPLRQAMESIGDGEVTMAYWAVSDLVWPQNPDEQQLLDFLRATGDERPGIPLHKLSTNDGWWITDVECRSALDIWERAGSPMVDEFRDDWVPFLQAAAKNGGFRTY